MEPFFGLTPRAKAISVPALPDDPQPLRAPGIIYISLMTPGNPLLASFNALPGSVSPLHWFPFLRYKIDYLSMTSLSLDNVTHFFTILSFLFATSEPGYPVIS